MKTYAKGVTVTPQLVNAAIELWKTKEAGRKNRWRIYSEFGNADDLANLIASEVDSRSLYFSPLKTKQRVDGYSGKTRDIGIEPIKQQICGYVIELAVKPLIDARDARFFVFGRKTRICNSLTASCFISAGLKTRILKRS